ncbi:MAG: hypothetical protein R6V39_05000 [Desulfovibrionales bacterium]
MKKVLPYCMAFAGLLIMGAMHSGCMEGKSVKPSGSEVAKADSCLGCHTNYALLQEKADPVQEPPAEGCGGAAPFIEPYDRVYLGGPGFERFRDSTHGQIGCTACHGGIDNTSNKEQAHSGDFVRSPSSSPEAACADCHYDIVQNVDGSLHQQGWGQKNSVVMRMGKQSFEQLPEGIHQGYEQNCATCHASCGDCHVTRPEIGGGGLYKGHDFQRTPDMRDNCVACHSSRGGHAYFGLGAGTRPDIHLTQAGFECVDCHDQKNVHGDGNVYATRYESPLNPSCQDCHPGLEQANAYHEAHVGDLDCQICHSQVYNNCGSCHVGGEGARIASYLDFKIGINPIPDEKPYRMALLRRTLAAPDSWSEYGVKKMSDFDAKTTFNYTTPHNIQRWTARTQVDNGDTCFANCHVRPDETENHNRDLYLFEKDLVRDWEKAANQEIVVDGRLPESWR